MEDNLYLVTMQGERHEDHIPVGFYDYHQLQEKFPFNYEMEIASQGMSLEDGEWYELTVLNTSDWNFSEEEKENFRSGKWEPAHVSYETMMIRVILVQKNKEIDQT